MRDRLLLILMRHAKSSWADAGLDDFDRPLNARGRQAAPVMAAALVGLELRPTLVLCSPAARTWETLQIVLETPGCGDWRAVARFEPSLYLADPATILSCLAERATGCRQVLVIGHNPGLHELAVMLAGDGAPASLSAMARKFPTAAVAVVELPAAATWSSLQPRCGRLLAFITPAMRIQDGRIDPDDGD